MNKLISFTLDYLPAWIYLLWSICTILSMFFIPNIWINAVPVVGIVCFWLSVKYHNKWLKYKHKMRTNND